MRPSLPTTGIMSGVAIATSKSVKPPSTRSARSSAPTRSAPASSASRALSPLANTATVISLPSPCGSEIVPRSCWSAWRTFSPVRMCTSTVSSNLAGPNPFRSLTASAGEYCVLAVDRLEALPVALPVLRHRYATSTPIERAVPSMILDRLVHVVRVQVGHLLLGDLAHLVLGDRADLVAVRLARALLEPDRLLDQHRGRRGLRDERERAVLEDRDLDRDDRAGVLLGLRVERLAELHDVHAVLAQRRADRRSRVGAPAGTWSLMRVRTFLPCRRHSPARSS